MEIADFGAVEGVHWRSAEEVGAFIERQGIASLLAFDGERCVGQLYLKAYDPDFQEPGGWTGNRPWADFAIAEPLDLAGRPLTVGCFHVGRSPDGAADPSVRGRGVGTALLRAAVEWAGSHPSCDGLLTWGLVAGAAGLHEWAGQLSHATYRRFGFREIARVSDPRLEKELAGVDLTGAEEDPAVMRVMLL